MKTDADGPHRFPRASAARGRQRARAPEREVVQVHDVRRELGDDLLLHLEGP